MKVELTEQARELIDKQLAQGNFTSAGELVESALEFFDECHTASVSCVEPGTTRPLLNDGVRKAVQQGLDDVAAGRVTVCQTEDELAQVFDDVKREGRRRLDANRNAE